MVDNNICLGRQSNVATGASNAIAIGKQAVAPNGGLAINTSGTSTNSLSTTWQKFTAAPPSAGTLAVPNAVAFLRIILSFFMMTWSFSIVFNSIQLGFDGIRYLYCDTTATVEYDNTYLLLWIYYLSKYYELIDTLIIVLKNGDLIFLHYYHHAIIIPVTWAWVVFQMRFGIIGLLVNTGVHVIMYSYYAASILVKNALLLLFAVDHTLHYFKLFSLHRPLYYHFHICGIHFIMVAMECLLSVQRWKAETWKDGRKNGLERWWYQNGRNWIERTWTDGNLNNLERTWYPNGQRKTKKNWKDNKLDGMEQRWFKDGRIDLEVTWKDGLKHGLEQRWYQNGRNWIPPLF